MFDRWNPDPGQLPGSFGSAQVQSNECGVFAPKKRLIGKKRIRWIRSTLLPQVSWPDPNLSDLNPDSTNRKGANPVDPVNLDPDPTNRTFRKVSLSISTMSIAYQSFSQSYLQARVHNPPECVTPDPALHRVLVERNRIFASKYRTHLRGTWGVAGTPGSKTTVPCLETGLALVWSVRMTSEDPITFDQDPMQSWIRRCTLWGLCALASSEQYLPIALNPNVKSCYQ